MKLNNSKTFAKILRQGNFCIPRSLSSLMFARNNKNFLSAKSVWRDFSKLSNKKGESFTEIIIAALLLAILAAFSSSSFIDRKKTMITAGYRIEAKNFALKKLEILIAKVKALASAGKFPTLSSETFFFEDRRSANQQWIDTDEVDNDGFVYKKISVKVDWNED